jgi:gamma-glutamylaminecyclotransferase
MYIKVKVKIPLFVYGTLRKGEPTSKTFLNNSKYLGKAYTLDKYLMTIEDKIPYLLEIPYTYITGDLYEIDLQTLRDIDKLEGHPTFYIRKIINIFIENSQEAIQAITYFSAAKINETGDFKNQKLRQILC